MTVCELHQKVLHYREHRSETPALLIAAGSVSIDLLGGDTMQDYTADSSFLPPLNYRIENAQDGSPILVRSDGLPIGDTERDFLIEAVQSAWRRQGADALALEGQQLARTAQWVFPLDRTDTIALRCGVYFAIDESYPGLVKIGYTTGSITDRINQLRHNHGCVNPQLLAAALHSHPIRLEATIHATLRHARVHLEWFDRQAVESYLSQFKPDGEA